MRSNGKKIRFGVLGTARIAVKKVIPAMQKGDHTEVVAIASRSAEKGRKVAHYLRIPRWHGSYEALLADPEIDAIYNPLPNHLHVPWSIRAPRPASTCCARSRSGSRPRRRDRWSRPAAAATTLKVMEAFMDRHHPQWRTARELVTSGQIGELRPIQTFFSYLQRRPGQYPQQSRMGGGGLMDIGCYASSLSRWLFNAEPQRVSGFARE